MKGPSSDPFRECFRRQVWLQGTFFLSSLQSSAFALAISTALERMRVTGKSSRCHVIAHRPPTMCVSVCQRG